MQHAENKSPLFSAVTVPVLYIIITALNNKNTANADFRLGISLHLVHLFLKKIKLCIRKKIKKLSLKPRNLI